MKENKDFINDILKKINVKHVDLILREDWGFVDFWLVIFDGKTFEYFTGIGHRVPIQRQDNILRKNLQKIKSNLSSLKSRTKVKKVDSEFKKNVLYCLLSDIVESTFKEFCDDFCYDIDSIKALKTYEACLDNTKKIKEILSSEEIELLRDYFQDY